MNDASQFLQAHNVLRVDNKLQFDEVLAQKASDLVDKIIAHNCIVNEKDELQSVGATDGVNTFAMLNCDAGCPWQDILNSWVAETGGTCNVAHRTTALNPDAQFVGCASRRREVSADNVAAHCHAAACVYDAKPSTEQAKKISATHNKTLCNRTACCNALPCRNTTCPSPGSTNDEVIGQE
jgi:hypothetical protein